MRSSSSFRRCFVVLVCAIAIVCGSHSAVAQSGAGLEQVLNQMDKAHASFHSLEANFVWDIYIAVVNETDTQKGKIYFRRSGDETQMAVDVTSPNSKYVVLTGEKLQLYQKPPDQVTVVNLQKNHAEFESFLVLGFGGGGHDMEKSYELKYLGTENVSGVETAKLDLIPKNPKVLNMFPHIVLWIDPARGLALQQQLFQPNEDYRLSKYSEIQLNGRKIPDSVFKLKTDAQTKFQDVSPQN